MTPAHPTDPTAAMLRETARMLAETEAMLRETDRMLIQGRWALLRLKADAEKRGEGRTVRR